VLDLSTSDGRLSVPTLGVGLLYNPALPPFLESNLDALDYLEVIPDMFWTDNGPAEEPRYAEIESWMGVLEAVAAERPIVAHNIGFSLASADIFDPAYLEQIASWQQRFGFRWHSDHLAFGRVTSTDGSEHQAGLGLPVPYDGELLDLLAGRIASVQERIEAPFLIENNVYFVEFPEQEMTEPEFLNALTERAGCGLLLDIHNLYVNARNHGFDAFEFIDDLDLSRVIEIHIAGGGELAGMYTDSHSGPCPEPVWELLDAVVPRAENLAGVTFEFHDSYYPQLGPEGTRRELQRARETLDRHRRG
jgi:uncharacterized protein